jgi:hypothetical protein
MVMLDQKKAFDDNAQMEKIKLFEQYVAQEQAAPSAASSSGPQVPSTPGAPAVGERPPNPTIIRVSFHEHVSFTEIRPQIDAWLAESSGPADFEWPKPKPRAN